jgi:hypothetical protein
VTSEPEGRFVLARALETTFVSLLASVGGRSGGNRTRWGTSRRLGGLFGVVSRAGSDRDPEVPSDGAGGLLREATRPREKHGRGGREPNGQSGKPRRGEGQESIGFCWGLTAPRGERTLGWSNALESGFTPARASFERALTEPRAAFVGVVQTRLGGRRDRSSHRIGGLLPTRCG